MATWIISGYVLITEGLVLGKKLICNAGNVTWVISGNALITEGLVIGGKHFCYTGNVTWNISVNALITEGLVPPRRKNTFVKQEMPLGLYPGMLL